MDYELFLLKEKVKLLLSDNNHLILNNYNNFQFEPNKFSYEINDSNINESIKNINILELYNNFKYISNLNEFENNCNCNFLNINNNNQYINNNNSKDILLNDKSLFYYNKFLKNNIPKNIFENDDCNFFNIKNSYDENKLKKNYAKYKKIYELKKINKKVKIIKFFIKKRFKFQNNKKKNNYKGISRNRKKWQAYIMINKKNTYLGSYNSEITAAKVYDFMAIKKSGFRAKTNFKYNYNQIIKIYKLNINANNISEIVSKNGI